MTKSRGIHVKRRPYTEVDMIMVRDHYPDTPTAVLAEALGRAPDQVYRIARTLGVTKSAEYMASEHACRLRRGDNIGAEYRFKPGIVPANKGKKRPGWSIGRMAETQFKKGRPASEARNYVCLLYTSPSPRDS